MLQPGQFPWHLYVHAPLVPELDGAEPGLGIPAVSADEVHVPVDGLVAGGAAGQQRLHACELPLGLFRSRRHAVDGVVAAAGCQLVVDPYGTGPQQVEAVLDGRGRGAQDVSPGLRDAAVSGASDAGGSASASMGITASPARNNVPAIPSSSVSSCSPTLRANVPAPMGSRPAATAMRSRCRHQPTAATSRARATASAGGTSRARRAYSNSFFTGSMQAE
jgi:hypothetical protein